MKRTSRTWKLENVEKLKRFVETRVSPMRAALTSNVQSQQFKSGPVWKGLRFPIAAAARGAV
jgi:hypothetical protein